MPVKKPCKICRKPVKINQNQLFCTECNSWLHLKCTDISVTEYPNLVEETYICPLCELTDCFTSESEDDLSVNSILTDTPNSSISPPDPPAESASDQDLRLRGLDFDSLPVTNPINTLVDTQLGCDFLDPQLVRVIKIKYACVVCNKRVTNAQKSICCNVCDEWTHKNCARVSDDEFEVLRSTEKPCYCVK